MVNVVWWRGGEYAAIAPRIAAVRKLFFAIRGLAPGNESI